MLGESYRVMISGHSLGGALSAIFGLYTSTDPRMIRQGLVIVHTFAAPMVGCHAFADAFRHQEQTGKLRHARLYNEFDVVPRFPLNMKLWDERKSSWSHTGIGVKLPKNDSWSILALGRWLGCCNRRRHKQDKVKHPCIALIDYASAKNYYEAAIHACQSNLILHVDPFNLTRNESLYAGTPRSNATGHGGEQ